MSALRFNASVRNHPHRGKRRLLEIPPGRAWTAAQQLEQPRTVAQTPADRWRANLLAAQGSCTASRGQLYRHLQILGEGTRAGVYPISATQAYWYVSFNDSGEAFTMPPHERKATALKLVAGWQNGIVECIEHTDGAAISRNRFFDRLPPPWGGRVAGGAVTLAGDALHPMTPNLGQVRDHACGGCAAPDDTQPGPGARSLHPMTPNLGQVRDHTRGGCAAPDDAELGAGAPLLERPCLFQGCLGALPLSELPRLMQGCSGV